jgi:hypothetical protein
MQSNTHLSRLQQLTKGQNFIEVKDLKTKKVLGAIFVETYRGQINGSKLIENLREQNHYLREHPERVLVGIADAPGSPIPDFVTNLVDSAELKEFVGYVKNGRVLKLILVTKFPLLITAAAIYSRMLHGSSLLEKLSAEEAIPRAEELIRQYKSKQD